MIKDKISHLHKIWADLCKVLNKPGGVTVDGAMIAASQGSGTGMLVRDWYYSGLVQGHAQGSALDLTKFETALKGLCGVVVDGKTLVQTPDGFKVTGDILREASSTLRALTTLSERSPDMPVTEDLYAVAKVVEHKVCELTTERDGLRRDMLSALRKSEALVIQNEIKDGHYQSLRRFVIHAILDVNEIAKCDLRSDPDLTQSTDMLCAELRGVTQQAVSKYKFMGQSIASLCTLIDPDTSFVLTKNKDRSEDLRLLTLLLKEQAKREDQARLGQINDLQDHVMDLRQVLGWSEPITGKRVIDALAMTVDRVKSEIARVREALCIPPGVSLSEGVRVAVEQFTAKTMRMSTDMMEAMTEVRTENERLGEALTRHMHAQDLAQIFADEMARFKVVNYLEYRFDAPSGARYTATIRRLDTGKTPGEIAAENVRRAKAWKALAKRLLKRLNAPTEAQQQDWTLAVTPNDQTSATVPGLTTEQEKAVLMIWPTCGGTFKVGETQIMGYRGTAEQVAGVGEYLFKHGHAVSWERQT